MLSTKRLTFVKDFDFVCYCTTLAPNMYASFKRGAPDPGGLIMQSRSTGPVFGFMYQCQEAEPLSEAEIAEILEVSRRNNESRGITGMLLYRDGRFLQVLEGDKAPVLDLVKTIRRDPRQKAFTVLYESEWPRLFAGWFMDFRKLVGRSTAVSGLSLNDGNDADLAAVLSRAPLRVRKRLVTFAAGA